MKKILSLIVFLFSIVLLVGCTGTPKEELKAVQLTSEEKFELLQEMDSPSLKVIQTIVELKGSVDVEGFAVEFDGKFNSYTDLSVRTNIFNYTTIDLKLLSPQFNVEGKGSLYTNLQGLYLDLNGYYSIGGTKVTLEGQEVMDITPYTDGEVPQDVYDEMIGLLPWDQFQDLNYEEIKDQYLDQLLDFITVYQDNNKTTLKVSVTKAKIYEIADLQGSREDLNESFTHISDDSKLEFEIQFTDKKLTKISLNAVFKMPLPGNEINVSGKVEIIFNGKAPTLPTQTQLDNYREVEYFTILGPFFGFPGSAQPEI